MQATSLVPGLCGLLLRRLLLLTLIGLLVAPSLPGALRLGGVVLRFAAREKIADAHESGDVFMYRDSSVAPLLDLGRRFKAVIDVLDATIRDGISLARSVELSAQWDSEGWACQSFCLGGF